jgi:hypothetical protein
LAKWGRKEQNLDSLESSSVLFQQIINNKKQVRSNTLELARPQPASSGETLTVANHPLQERRMGNAPLLVNPVTAQILQVISNIVGKSNAVYY